MSEKQKRFYPYGQRLRDERKRLRLTQEAFAALGGVTVQTQRSYESGRSAPNSDYLNRLVEAGVDVHYIVASPMQQGPRQVLLRAEEAEMIEKYRNLSAYWQGKMDAYLDAAIEADVRSGTNNRVRARQAALDTENDVLIPGRDKKQK